MNLSLIPYIALSTILLCGCQEESTDIPMGNVNYPNINLPIEELQKRIVNQNSGVGVGTVWLCYEPPTGDVIMPTSITLNSDGNGTYQPFGTAEPMTWSLQDDVLTLVTEQATISYHDLSMPISTVLNATIPPLQASADLTASDSPISDGTGSFSCIAGYEDERYDVLVPVGDDVFTNGANVSSADSRWDCQPLTGNNNHTHLQMTLELALTLGADGSGNIKVGDQTEQSVSHWQLNDRTINLTASDGTTVNITLEHHNGENFIADTEVDGVRAGKKDCVLTR